MHEVDTAIGQHVFVLAVAFLDAGRVADFVQLGLVASTDGVHIGFGMLLIDRDELRPESQADDRNVESLVGHVAPRFAQLTDGLYHAVHRQPRTQSRCAKAGHPLSP